MPGTDSHASDARASDSAGQPWAGRHFSANTSATDDGTVTPALAVALQAFHDGHGGPEAVVDAFRDARLLVPLVSHLAEAGVDEHGRRVDKKQELAIVTVAGPEGRNVLPVFSCVATMSAWNPKARPVPQNGARVALGAASEQTELVVLDPGSDTEFVLRRPALWALAQGQQWIPSYSDAAVRDAFTTSIERELAVHAVELTAGDPGYRLSAPELVVHLQLAAGLSEQELDVVMARLAARWAADDAIATRVDSLTVRLTTAPD
nr:SseB family protein [Glaciibacter superstes]